MFEGLGINRTEEQVYLRLLRHGPASVATLVLATGLTRRNVRMTVERLNALGLVSHIRQDRYVAIPLEVGVDHLIQQKHHDLELLRHVATKVSAEMHGRDEHNSGDQVTVLAGRSDVSVALQQLSRAARDELRILIRSPTDEAMLRMPGRGLTCRMVLDTSLEHVTVGSEAQLRLSSNVPATVALADRTSALFPLEQTALIIKPGNLFSALEALFDAVWTAATPLGWGSRESIDDQDRELLSLLVAGLTDDAAGARLGMSRRTVARRVQRLMQVTGAHSRLQLGWWAREREWL